MNHFGNQLFQQIIPFLLILTHYLRTFSVYTPGGTYQMTWRKVNGHNEIQHCCIYGDTTSIYLNV